MKIHVREKRMLRYMEAHCDRRWIAVSDLEVDVAHCRIKRIRIGIGHVVVRRYRSGRGKCNSVAGPRMLVRCQAREHYHHAHALPETWGIWRQYEHWARDAIANEPDTRPQKHSAGYRVT